MPLPRQHEFDPGLPPAEYALPEAPSAEFMDIPKAFGAGTGEGTHAIGEGMKATGRQLEHNTLTDPASGGVGGLAASIGLDELGNLLSAAGKGVGDFFHEHLSEGGKQVADTPIYQDGHFTETAKNPLNWPIVAADALGQTAPILASSALGGVPLATAAGFTQNNGAVSEAVHSAISQTETSQLMQSPTFVNLFKNIDQAPQYSNYSDLQKIDLAKKQLADKVAMADLGDPRMLAASLVAAYSGDAYLGQVFAGKVLSNTIAKTIAKTAVRDGGVNASYMGVSQYLQNEGMNNLAGANIDPGAGVQDQAVTGGVTGLMMGTVPAVVGHLRQTHPEPAAPHSEDVRESPIVDNDDKAAQAVDDIQEGVEEAQQGVQDLKEEVTSDSDLFSNGLGERSATGTTTPEQGYRAGLTEEQLAEQQRLAKGFSEREKYGGNGPDDFADVPAYMRAGKKVEIDPDSRPYHMIDASGDNGQVKARFDNKHDAEIFQNAQLLDQYSRGNHPQPDAEEHQAVKDWFYRMTRGVKREDVESKKRKRSKKDQKDAEPQRQPRSDFEAGNIRDTIMGYYLFVKDAARDAENGEFTAPSMEDYADYSFPDRPLQIEDKNIIFAGGPTRAPLADEGQSGNEPEFRGGKRIHGQEFIPADRPAAESRAGNVIEGEAHRIYPLIEDKNIIFSGGPIPDEGQRGRSPQFEGGETKAKRRLDRFEERIGSRQRHPALPHRQLSSGEIAIPDSVTDVATAGNGEIYLRKNGKPFPSEGLARLSKPYTDAKKAGEQPKVVEVEGGYGVEVPKPEKVAKKPELPKLEKRPPVEGLPIDVSPDDIPFEDARDAFAGSSMNPEKRAREQQDGYVETIRNLYSDMQEMTTPQNEPRIPELLKQYRDGYRDRLNAYMRSRHGTLSSAIAGRSKFNTDKNARNLSREQQKLEELTNWDTRVRKTIKEALTRKSTEEAQHDALRQYNSYKGALEKMQKANAVIRGKKDVEPQLRELGFTEEQIDALLHPDFGKPGFDAVQMSKMKKGMEKHARAVGIRETEGKTGESLSDKKGKLTDDEIAVATDGQLEATLRDIAKDHYRGLSNTEKDVIRRLEQGHYDREDARSVVRAHRDYWNRREAEGVASDHARDNRLNELYGHLSISDLEKRLDELNDKISGLQKAGRREFTGSGTRRTGAAQSNEVARVLGESKMYLERYLEHRREQEAINIHSQDDHQDFFDRLIEHPDQVTPEQVKSALESTIANKEAVTSSLNKLTREKLRPYQGYHFDSSTKKDRMVATAYETLLNQYRWLTNKGDVMVTSGRQSNEERARDAISNITQEDINDYAAAAQKSRAERKSRIEAHKAAIDNPQTMEDFRAFVKAKGRDALTSEQSERLDQLLADEHLKKQKDRAEAPRVTSGFSHDDELKINPIEQGKNSKTGETIYNVNLETRLGSEKFKDAAATARKLGGGYWRGNFWFPTEEKAQQFTNWLRGESVDHTADDAARREEKEERQTERLTKSAEQLQDNAEERLNADRKVNTAKRIREAAYATASAERDLRDADLLRKIAEGKADGSVKYLTGLQHKTQLATLRQIANRLVYDIPHNERDDLTYTTWDGKREWNDNVPVSTRVKYARYPMLDWNPNSLTDLLPQMAAVRGYKLASEELRLSQALENGLARLPAGRKANDKLATWLQTQSGSWPDYVSDYNRLQRAGITTRPILRSALTELMRLDGEIPVKKVPRLTKMEQDLRMKLAGNRNAFVDFFPTPESRADYFVEQADIQPGMDVLEPSAGNGVLADAARRAGANVDVVELAHDLRDILSEKGHTVVGSDFDEFKSDKLYDRILMNPPFSNDLDVQHVRKAWEHLKPGGRLAAIVSSMAGERQNKRNQAFREWLDGLDAKEERLPEGMFKDSMNPTSVATKLITMDKPLSFPAIAQIAELREIYGPGKGYSRRGAELQREILSQLDTDTGYKFHKLLESQFHEDRQRAIDIAEQYLLKKNDRSSELDPDVHFSLVPRSGWRNDFPDVVIHGRLGDATAHPDYEAAKGGDDAAARRLVADVMTRKSVHKLRGLVDGRKAILAAVHAEEAVSRNAIPQAMADILGKALGLEVDPALVQSAKVGRTAQDGFGRLTNQPAFEGPVRTDLPYILLDDTLTQGGTLANLKGYIEDHGGTVIGASALTGKQYSAKIAVAAETLRKLRDHFEGTDLENWWNEQHGYGFDKLTESEANYLIRAADADKIRARVLAARQDGAPPAEPGGTGVDGSFPPDLNHTFSKSASEPGGVFVSGSPRERIRSGVADYQPRGLDKSKIEAEAARFLKKWKGAGGIAVEVARDMAEAKEMAGFDLPDMHAVYLPNSNRVILVADHLDSLSHVRAKLRHEILGHHALSEVVGPAEYEKILRTVAAGQHSGSLKPYFDRVLETYSEADPWKQVEEVISHVLEDGERGVIGRAWDRVSGAVLQALRKVGILDEEGITAAEVRSLMRPVGERLKNVGVPEERGRGKFEDNATSFSLVGKDGLLSKPLPGETETEATQRRAKAFGGVVKGTINSVHQLRSADIIKRLTSRISTNALMINTLTNRQLAAVYKKLMKTDYAGDYQDLQAAMEARRNRIMNAAERGIENQWNQLDKEESRNLSNLMVDATMSGVHPDLPLAEQNRFQNLKNEQTRLRSSKSGEEEEAADQRLVEIGADLDAMRENYDELRRRWSDLSPEAKDLYHDTEKWYQKSYTELKEALLQRINDVGGDQNAAMISRIREQFERALKDGPYFPLARFGKYVVIARKDREYIREHFEDKHAALLALEAYKKDGYDAVQTVKSEVNGTNQDSAHSLGTNILSLLQKSEDGGSLNKDALTDQVWQLMLELMPDSSYARHFIRRRRVAGASHDARRAFANSAFHFAHHISKIEYGHKMGAVLDDMGSEIDAAMKGEYSGVKPDNLEVAQRMLDELKMRHEMTMNPSGDGFGNALTGTGYVFSMAANPSSALINMTQTALVALPQLASRYGWKNAVKALSGATVDYFRSADKRFKWFGKGSSWLDRDAWLSMSRSKHLNADDLALLKRLNEDGVISITQASSLAQRAESGTQDKIHFNKALDMSILIGGQLFHNVEVANREVTALAAYRLAKQAGGGHIDPQQAYKVASNAVFDGHFDYSSSNRPRWMRKSWQKVIFQFKMYAQHMFYTLGRSAEQSFRGETAEVRSKARKEFMGYMLMHTLAAGVTGLPYAVQAIFGAAAQGIHSVLSDDDGPWDPEVALKNWLSDDLGGFASTAITDGLVNALGIDLHSRVGIQDLLWRSPPEGTEGKDLYVYYMEQMLGPTIGGIGLNFANGYDKMAKGDWLGGIQTVTPAAIKNLVKTYSEATRGVTTSSGEEVVSAGEFTGFELAAQALGFTPSRIGQAYDARSAIKNVLNEYSDKRSQLLQRFFNATMNGDDTSDIMDDIQSYNEINPQNAISGEVITRSIREKNKARLKKMRGLALSRKDEHFRSLGRFGDSDPLF